MSTETSFSLRRKVLFVDDEPAFLGTAGKWFEELSKGSWEVYLQTQTSRALSLLEEQSVDLVVLDVLMPGVDGTQFLSILGRKYPDLPKAVLTGDARTEQRSACLAAGANLFLEKPTSSEGYENVFAALNELTSLNAQVGFRGLLKRVGLPDVIQMECLARNSSLLELATPEVKGRIYIQAGEIIHAEAGSERGAAAFDRLLSLKSGNFSLKPFEDPGRRTMKGNWEILVMEALRKQDEATAVEDPARVPSVPEAGSSSDRPASSPLLETPEPPRDIEEVMVSSEQGEVFYAWQCSDIEGRLTLVQFAKQHVQKVGAILGLGDVERLEIDGAPSSPSRVVAQFQSDRTVWVRATPVAASTKQLTMDPGNEPPLEACA